MALRASIVVLGLLLAGCSSQEEAAQRGPPDSALQGAHGGHNSGTHLLAPNWTVGDSWMAGGADGSTFSLVVSGDAGADWVMDTDNEDLAFADARFDVSFLGKIRKSDLAGSQGGDRIEFLRFPLTQDLTWTTTWDGQPITILAAKVQGGKAEMEARRADGTLYAQYTYGATERYFTAFKFFEADGQTEQYAWTLHHAAPGFTGDLVRYELATLLETTSTAGAGTASTFSVEPGATDLHVSVAVTCSTGAVSVTIGPPDGFVSERGFAATGPCPINFTEQVALPMPPEPEEWGAFIVPTPAGDAAVTAVVLERTLVSFKAGSVPA